MHYNFSRTGSLFGFSLAVCCTLLLSGCNNDDDKVKPEATKPAVQEPAQASPQRRETVELLPDKAFKRHVFNEFNQEIETHMSTTNGSESEFRYPDGKLQESIKKDKSGKITQRRLFARDGKTVIGGLESRSDGSTLWSVEQSKDKTVTKTTYWYDGKRPFSVELTRPDGSVEIRYYRKSGSLWQKKFGPDAANLVTEQYDSNGKLNFQMRKLQDGNTEFLRFHDNGNLKYRYLGKLEKSSYSSYEQWTGVSAEEYDASGKRLLRRIKLESYNSVSGTETFNDDGTRTVRKLRWNNRVESEEVFDKDGNSISKKEYKWDEDVSETIDRSQYERPALDDPATRWRNQEDFSYYRYGDD